MTEVAQSPVRKISFSSDISDLPPTDDIDERIAKIKEAIQKSEIKRQLRVKHFRIRLKQCLDRIETLEEKQVDRLAKDGIIISLEKVKAEASSEVQKEKKFQYQRNQEVYEQQVREIERQKVESPPETEINEWPQNTKEERIDKEDTKNLANLSNEKLVYSVKEELAKLNLNANANKNKKTTRNKKDKKDPKNKEPIVLPVAKNEKPVHAGRRGSLQQDASELRGLERRGSLTGGLFLGGAGNGRRGSVTLETPDKKYLERRRSSLRDPPDWMQKAPGPEVGKKNTVGKDKKSRR